MTTPEIIEYDAVHEIDALVIPKPGIEKLEQIMHPAGQRPLLDDEIVNFALRSYGYGPVNSQTENDFVLIHSQCTAAEIRRYRLWVSQGRPDTFCFAAQRVYSNYSLGMLHERNAGCPLESRSRVRLMAMPLHGSGHWSLLVVDLEQRLLFLFDSVVVAEMHGIHDDLAYTVRDMLAESGMTGDRWQIQRARCAQQTGSWECGFSVIACAAYMSGVSFPFCGNLTELVANAEHVRKLAADVRARSEAERMAQVYDLRLANYLSFK